MASQFFAVVLKYLVTLSFVCLMGVFHWSQLVGNKVFFKGREQCLQSWLRSVVVSRLVAVNWQNIKHICYSTDPQQLCVRILAPHTWKLSSCGSLWLVDQISCLVLYWYHLVWKNFHACCG